jgi:hypothetical protein
VVFDVMKAEKWMVFNKLRKKLSTIFTDYLGIVIITIITYNF